MAAHAGDSFRFVFKLFRLPKRKFVGNRFKSDLRTARYTGKIEKTAKVQRSNLKLAWL